MSTSVLTLILIGLAIALFVYITLHLMIARAFEMTPQLTNEESIVKICIMFNITDTTCDDVYGGIGPDIGKGKH